MTKYINSEWLKHKRTFYMKLIFIMPVVCILTALFLMGTTYVQSAGYNWWYMLFLPFTFTFIGAEMIHREKRYSFHGMFTLVEDKKKLWYAKVAAGTIVLVKTSAIFCILVLLCSLFGAQIDIIPVIVAMVLLVLTFAWQIPFFMYFTLKSNMFLSVIVSVFCNFGFACFCSVNSFWWIPFAIPAKLMCFAIGVLPNGLAIPQEELLNNTEVIASTVGIGVGVGVIMYVVATMFTAKLFVNQE